MRLRSIHQTSTSPEPGSETGGEPLTGPRRRASVRQSPGDDESQGDHEQHQPVLQQQRAGQGFTLACMSAMSAPPIPAPSPEPRTLASCSDAEASPSCPGSTSSSIDSPRVV